MKKTIALPLACFLLFFALSEAAYSGRLTLDCRAKKSPFDPYGAGRARIILDFDAQKAYLSASTPISGSVSSELEIIEVTGTMITLGQGMWISRTDGEFSHGLGYMNCRVAENQGF